jgi:NitT/TauT family transport system ATP-binding protein
MTSAPDRADARAPTSAALALDAVGKTYSGGVRALDAIALSVRPGEFVTLLGPSGCGKSTLLRLAAGLDTPSRGSIRWWGGTRDAAAAAGHRIAMVFQAATLMPWARVAANVRLPLDLANLERAAADRAVADALALVGLGGRAASFPRELSGGMQMRVSIARALVTEPHLLLLDEPFGALDEITRNRLDAELLELWARRSLTIVFVTHSIYEAAFLSTRVLVMSAHPGRIAAEVEIDEPHPRPDSYRTSQRFAERCARLAAALAAASGAEVA